MSLHSNNRPTNSLPMSFPFNCATTSGDAIRKGFPSIVQTTTFAYQAVRWRRQETCESVTRRVLVSFGSRLLDFCCWLAACTAYFYITRYRVVDSGQSLLKRRGNQSSTTRLNNRSKSWTRGQRVPFSGYDLLWVLFLFITPWYSVPNNQCRPDILLSESLSLSCSVNHIPGG